MRWARHTEPVPTNLSTAATPTPKNKSLNVWMATPLNATLVKALGLPITSAYLNVSVATNRALSPTPSPLLSVELAQFLVSLPHGNPHGLVCRWSLGLSASSSLFETNRDQSSSPTRRI